MHQRAPGTGMPLARILAVGAAALVALLVLVGAVGSLAVRATHAQYHAATMVVYPLEKANDDALRSLVNVETAIRGFVITGDRQFLEPYQSGMVEYPRARQRLREIVAEHEDLSSRLDALLTDQEQKAAAWIDGYAAVRISQYSANETPLYRETTAVTAKRMFDEFRLSNARVATELAAIRTEQAEVAERNYTTAQIVIPASMLIAVLGGFVIYLMVSAHSTRPLTRLYGVLLLMRSGEVGVRAVVEGPTEVRAVGQAINELMDANDQLALIREQKAKQDSAIARISAKIREHLDLDELLSLIVSEIGGVLGPSHVRVSLLSGVDLDTHSVLAEWAAPGVQRLGSLHLTRTVLKAASDVFIDGRLFTSDDVRVARRFDPQVGEGLQAAGIRAIMALPLRIDDHVRGLLCVFDAAPRRWTDFDKSVLEGLGREISTAIGHARLYDSQRELVAKLTEVDRTRSDLVSAVSHELRTPLTSIRGYTEMLLDGDAGDLTAGQTQMIGVVERNTRRLLLLIEDLLTLSRVESGAFRPALAPLDVLPLFRSVATAMAPTLSNQNLRLSLQLAAGPLTVRGDSAQLERVVINLVSNAAKFSPDGSEITVRVSREGSNCVAEVRDRGMGIPVEEQSKLFTKFFRSSLAKSHSIQGTGLGLTIVKSILDNHGGTISVSSQEGQGTTVRFELPLCEVEPAAIS